MPIQFRGLLLWPLLVGLLCSCTQTGVAEPDASPPDVEAAADSDQSAEQTPSLDEFRENNRVIHRVRGGEPGPDGWCLAEATRGNFTVMLPAQFQDVMVTSPTVTGGTGIMHSVSTFNADGVEFNVLQTEIIGKRPEGSPLDAMINRFDALGATVAKSDVKLGDQPAVKLHVEARGVVAEFAFLSTTDSDYMLAVQLRAPDADSAIFAADAERFFQSFRIKEKTE